MQKYEYKFIRIGEGWTAARSAAESEYKNIITHYASEGWKLIQIFAPSTGVYGAAKYYEIILEKPLP